jgi:fumarylacetoacetate (FAA) hydrolase
VCTQSARCGPQRGPMHQQHHGGEGNQSPGLSTACGVGVGWIHGRAVPRWHRAAQFNVACILVGCVWDATRWAWRLPWGESGAAVIQSDNSPMKLATYKDGSRDGQLVVVSRDLGLAHYASNIANRLQQVLDDWNYLAPQLQDLYDTLNNGRARHAFPFDSKMCMAPLPRAYQWADGSAYLNHVELVRKARGAEVPESFYTDPLMLQGGSDDLQGASAPIVCANLDWGLDFEAELAVVTGDIPQGCAPDRALDGIRLLMLANDVTLRNLIPAELAKGFGFVQSKPATAFSPVAVTPDELGGAWAKGRVHLPLLSTWNGRKVGQCDAGRDMSFHFGQLIAHLAKTRNVRAGSIIGSGTVSNKGVTTGAGDKARTDWPNGYSCIAEKRAIETIQDGQPSTGFMQFGDTIRIEMKGADGQSIFGAIEQEVEAPAATATTIARA